MFRSIKGLLYLLCFVCSISSSASSYGEEGQKGSASSFLSEKIMGQSGDGSGNSASSSASQETEFRPNLITMLSSIAIVSLIPFSMMMLTSFLKIVIVLSLLRNALGVQQSPPNQAINGIALLMTIYVMFPTGLAMYHAASDYIQNKAPTEMFSANSAEYIISVANKTKLPLKEFLLKNLSSSHQKSFYQLAYQKMPDPYRSQLRMDDLIIIVPAYVTSQIKGAFEVGVLIYLPFFVIDLVTSNILLAMGMMMLSPLTIALPLKLLLVVMVDGWTLIIQGLVQTYRS